MSNPATDIGLGDIAQLTKSDKGIVLEASLA
jgi:hypothetical protein